MLFESKKARATFHKAMDAILASVKWQMALFYLHNVIIFMNESGQRATGRQRIKNCDWDRNDVLIENGFFLT